jgi:hypothetical protein
MWNNVGNAVDNIIFFLGYIRERFILVGSNIDNLLNELSGPVEYKPTVVYNIYGSEIEMIHGCY